MLRWQVHGVETELLEGSGEEFIITQDRPIGERYPRPLADSYSARLRALDQGGLHPQVKCARVNYNVVRDRDRNTFRLSNQ